MSDEEKRFQGAPVSEGIAIGKPYFLGTAPDAEIPQFQIATGKVEEEIARYRKALSSSREDLEKLQADLSNLGSLDAMHIIGTHIEMLEDPLMTVDVEMRIRDMRQNTEMALSLVIDEYKVRFSKTSDHFFQQRLTDVLDLSQRILGHLCFKKRGHILDIPPNSVVFSQELAPSDTAAAQASRVSAFVTQLSGGNSHAALIARAKGIPLVASVDMQQIQSLKGKCVIVDGLTGEIIVNPTRATLRKYQELKERLQQNLLLFEEMAHLSAETQDGFDVKVFANIGSLAECEYLNKTHGVGLFRSENLFLENPELFIDEEGQFRIYRELLKQSCGLPVVVRVFDVGGDKPPPRIPGLFLGGRGIRFLLQNQKLFKMQLRALLRAAPFGDLRILLPLVCDVNELKEVKFLINQIKRELHLQVNVPVGCMIEVPSAILIADILAKEANFFSIGTNDLIQYALGVDRSQNQDFLPAHPSVIRLLKMTIVEARRHNLPVTICGEIASSPIFIPLLLGLGIHQISCSLRFIPQVKWMIRNCTLVESCQIADLILQMQSPSEIVKLLMETYRRVMPEGPLFVEA